MLFELLKAFVSNYLILITIISTLYILGKIVKSIFNLNVNLFQELVISFFLIVIFASIWYSTFRTIFIIPFLLIILYIIYFIKNRNGIYSISISFSFIYRKEFHYLLVFSSFPLLVHLFHNFHPEINEIIISYCDDIFYGRMSGILVDSGIEANRGLNDIFKVSGIMPYHYSELWFSGFWNNIFDNNLIINHVLITYSVGNIIIVIGYKFLFFKDEIWKLRHVFFCFLLTFVSGNNLIEILLDGRLYIIQNMGLWVSDALTFPKLFPIYILILFVLISFKQNQLKYIPYCLFMLTIVYFTLIPGVFVLLFLLLIYFVYNNDKIYYHYLIATISVLLIFLIYKIWGSNNLNVDISFKQIYFNNTQEAIKSFIYTFVSNTLELILSYVLFFPIIILYLLNIETNKRNYSLFFVVISILVASLFSGIMYFQFDSWQILANYAVPIINILISYVMYFFIYKINNVQIKLFAILLILIPLTYKFEQFTNGYFTPRLSQIEKQLLSISNDKNGELFAYWGNHRYTDNSYRSSIIANGINSKLSIGSSLNHNRFNTWTINLKMIYNNPKWYEMYPFEYFNTKSKEIAIENIHRLSRGILIVDKGEIVPSELNSYFKIVIVE